MNNNNKEYLNEEQYQKTAKTMARIGLPMMILGAVAFFSAIPLSMMGYMVVGGMMGFLGVPCLGIGTFLFLSSKQRAMSAFYAQSQIPIAKEGIEKVAPSVGVAAKEIAKGVKEGLKDEDE